MKIIKLNGVVIVIGGGLSGCFAAREIGKTHKVLFIEKENDIIPETSSSVAECYKLHLGLHYAGDAQTAVQCLERSVQFARECSDFILGKPGDPWRRGRHFVMSNSLIPSYKVKQVSEALTKKYEELIKLDPKNKVFGESKDFIRILEEKDYPEVAKEIVTPAETPVDSKNSTTLAKVNPKQQNKPPLQKAKVTLAIETTESQIDIQKLKASLKKELSVNPNITILCGAKVIRAAHAKDELGYVLTVQKKDSTFEEYHVPAVVNSAWDQIERIDKHLGYCAPHEGRIIRIKVSLVIKLPKAMHNTNTAIFSIGPHISLTNQGDGTAILTSEKFTNYGYYNAGSEPRNDDKDGDNKLTLNSAKDKELADNILSDAARYYPQLREATALKIRVGFVKMISDTEYNDSSIYDAKSSIHKRQEFGIEERDLCYFSNSGMKMTYTMGNGIELAKKVNEHFTIRENVIKILNLAKPLLSAALQKIGNFHLINIDLLLNYTGRRILLAELDKRVFAKNDKGWADFLVTELMKVITNKQALEHHGIFKGGIQNLKPNKKQSDGVKQLSGADAALSFLPAAAKQQTPVGQLPFVAATPPGQQPMPSALLLPQHCHS